MMSHDSRQDRVTGRWASPHHLIEVGSSQAGPETELEESRRATAGNTPSVSIDEVSRPPSTVMAIGASISCPGRPRPVVKGKGKCDLYPPTLTLVRYYV